MEFKPFIYNAKQEQIPVSIAPMTDADAQKTISAWQTAWTSDYLSDLRLEKYAAKLDEELIALGAYEILKNALVVHIAYMERSQNRIQRWMTEIPNIRGSVG